MKSKEKMNPKTIADIVRALRRSKRVLITSHREPDGDSICSQLVVRDYLIDHGKDCVIYNHGEIPAKYRFVKGVDLIKTDISDYDFDPDLIVVLESTHPDRIGKVQKLIKQGVPILNIDHHQGNQMYGDINLVKPGASSVGEMIYRIFQSDGYEFGDAARENIYIAILTDTGRFHFSSTTPDAMRIVAELIESGVDIRRVTDHIYFSMRENQLRVIGHVLSQAELYHDKQVCALTLRKELVEKHNMRFSEFEGIVDYSLQIDGVKIGVLFKDTGYTVTKVSIRSRNSIDVSELARNLGGGGHTSAAGITLDLKLADAKDLVLTETGKLLNSHG